MLESTKEPKGAVFCELLNFMPTNLKDELLYRRSFLWPGNFFNYIFVRNYKTLIFRRSTFTRYMLE